LAGQTSPGWRGDVLRGLQLAQHLRRRRGAMPLSWISQRLDDALGIDDEGAAQRQALLLDVHVEVHA
jgi:hypothetical protein